MAINLERTLRKALAELQAEQDKISRQIIAIKKVLATGDTGRARGRGRAAAQGRWTQKRMSAAARKAVSRRMKAYWAKRKAQAAKGKGEAGR